MDIKFRCWDLIQEKYIFTGFHVIGEVTCFNGMEQVIHETYQMRREAYGAKSSIDTWNDFIMEQYVGLNNKDDVELWEGDLVRYKGKIYKIVNDVWRYRLSRNLVEFGENENITIDEDVAHLSEYFGNIHQDMLRV